MLKPIRLISLVLLSCCISLAPAIANDFDDREALADKLTQDELAPLADAEEDLAMAEEVLAAAETARDTAEADLEASVEAASLAEDAVAAAQGVFDAAEQTLEDAIADGVMGEDLAALESAVEEAATALDDAQGDLTDAQGSIDLAQMVLDESDEVVAEAETDRDEALEVVQLITDEIEGTEEFVDSLDDRRVFALNRSLNNAVRTDLLPLDIDLDLLQRIVDEDFGNGEIQQLTQAFEMEARFERLAARFDAKATDSGDDKFAAHAERTRARGAERRSAFLNRLGDGSEETGEAADLSETLAMTAAIEVAAMQANDAASEQAALAVGAVAREAAAEAAETTVGEIAREVAQEQGRGGRP